MTIENLKSFDALCTGCMGCMNICPKNAIKAQRKADGFAYPVIDKDLCIDCGLCAGVCHMQNKKEYHPLLKVYSAHAKDPDIRKSGSSGGVFPLLAQKTVQNDGVVYGVDFSRSKLAYHTSSDAVELSALYRSKYIQSDVGLVYREIGEKLLACKPVLFCGTPCQVRGLINYLDQKRIDKNTLTTVDFMCHGVPSPGYLEDYIARLENKNSAAVKNVTFREKDEGWRIQRTNFYFDNGSKYTCTSSDFCYYYFFLNNYTLRNSCFECEEYCSHVSDITIADYWNVDKKIDDDKGISLIIIHTEKGQQCFGAVMECCNVTELLPEQYNEKQYSHKKYSIKNKQKWIEAYKKGEKYVSTAFFKNEKTKNAVKRTARQYLGIAKKIIKTIVQK